MAASGSAVGLGNIWGFPTNTASNGGAAFLFTYLILAFALGYPALMAELIIGRHTRSNAVAALNSISTGRKSQILAMGIGLVGIVTVSLILSFYAIVSGWMMAFFLDPLARILGLTGFSEWLTTDTELRNAIFVVILHGIHCSHHYRWSKGWHREMGHPADAIANRDTGTPDSLCVHP